MLERKEKKDAHGVEPAEPGLLRLPNENTIVFALEEMSECGVMSPLIHSLIHLLTLQEPFTINRKTAKKSEKKAEKSQKKWAKKLNNIYYCYNVSGAVFGVRGAYLKIEQILKFIKKIARKSEKNV